MSIYSCRYIPPVGFTNVHYTDSVSTHHLLYNSTLSRVDTTKRHTSAKTTAVPRIAIAVSGVHHGVSLDLHDDRSAVAWLHGPGEVYLPRLIRPWPIESPTASKTV